VRWRGLSSRGALRAWPCVHGGGLGECIRALDGVLIAAVGVGDLVCAVARLDGRQCLSRMSCSRRRPQPGAASSSQLNCDHGAIPDSLTLVQPSPLFRVKWSGCGLILQTGSEWVRGRGESVAGDRWRRRRRSRRRGGRSRAGRAPLRSTPV
jgi:hypothetical protein